MLLRVRESVKSYKYDERILHFLSELSEMHTDPGVSDPRKLSQIPDDAISEGETRPNWSIIVMLGSRSAGFQSLRGISVRSVQSSDSDCAHGFESILFSQNNCLLDGS